MKDRAITYPDKHLMKRVFNACCFTKVSKTITIPHCIDTGNEEALGSYSRDLIDIW